MPAATDEESGERPPAPTHVVLRILRAELTRNFESAGQRMDPFAVVEYGAAEDVADVLWADRAGSSTGSLGGSSSRLGDSLSSLKGLGKTLSKGSSKLLGRKSKSKSGGSKSKLEGSEGGGGGGGGADYYDKLTLLSRTHTDWDAHDAPAWDFACRPLPIGFDMVVISLFEDEHVHKPKFMGRAAVSVNSLAESGGREVDLPLNYVDRKGREECTGTVTVRADLLRKSSEGGGSSVRSLAQSSGASGLGPVTRADPSDFVLPVKRLGVSGGTAPFFALVLKDPPNGKRPGHYIGKDLSRAVDEIAFYEEMLEIQREESNEDPTGVKGLLHYAFEYAGVLTAPEDLTGVEGADPSAPPLDLLVLRNLRDGCAELRLLDLKMGSKTASAGWQGKSAFRAKKQGVVDKMTNSAVEGYRLEGFDGQPESLTSMDPLLDVESVAGGSKKKKAARMMLQSMAGSEIMMHFLDLHMGKAGELDAEADLSEELCASELAELVLHETVRRLSNLAAACQRVTVPQKWVGSSVALGFDAGKLPPRSPDSLKAVRDGVLVNVFDWGRSELNTLEKMSEMSPEEQSNRRKFWEYYRGGVERLSWVAARAYRHQFGNSGGWETLTLTVYDFDSMSRDDFMGQVSVKIQEGPIQTASLGKSAGEIKFGIDWRACPAGSRLKGTWRINIVSASKLPNMDRGVGGGQISDPYVVVAASSADGRFHFEQTTSVIPNNLNPVWNEVLNLPVAATAGPGELAEALRDAAGEASSESDLEEMFPRPKPEGKGATALHSSAAADNSETSPAMDRWVGRLRELHSVGDA